LALIIHPSPDVKMSISKRISTISGKPCPLQIL
jgi:hypothetical protein